MGWEVRPVTADEVAALVRADAAAFGHQPDDAEVEASRAFLEADRLWAAADGEQLVGAAGALTMELTVPGPALAAAAGVTYVGVVPTHRRQGILTALMARLLDDAAGRGEPLAVLLASESTIYGRFGFGPAVQCAPVEVERAHARFRSPVDLRGRLRLVDRDDMAAVLPPVYDRYRRKQVGEVSRSPRYWAKRLNEPEVHRREAGARFAAVLDGGAGYVTYRLRQSWPDGMPHHTLEIEDLVATSPEAHAALWQYCLSVDLVGVVKAPHAPVDEPLPWMLADARRARVTGVHDFLWARLLDVEAALSARRYPADAALALDVADPFRPQGTGRYRLANGTCRRTDDPADLALDTADLAAAYLGAVRFSTLARAGRVTERTPGALERADALFATSPAPACSTFF